MQFLQPDVHTTCKLPLHPLKFYSRHIYSASRNRFSAQQHSQPSTHYVTVRSIDSNLLVRSIRAVFNGQSILNPALTQRALNWIHARPERNGPVQGQSLSPQEERVLALVAEGLTNKEIASTMQLSDKTVKNYLSNMFQKLHISRRAQAASVFVKRQA